MIPTDLANIALQQELGLPPIDDIEGDDPVSQACNLAYISSKEEALEPHWWKFAERRVSLALASGVEVTNFEYSYIYPSDCITLRYIYKPTRPTERAPFSTTTNLGGTLRYINSNMIDAIAFYTVNVTNVNIMKPLFRKAIVLAMAGKLAASEKRDLVLAKDKRDQAEKALHAAMIADANEDYSEPPKYDDFFNDASEI